MCSLLILKLLLSTVLPSCSAVSTTLGENSLQLGSLPFQVTYYAYKQPDTNVGDAWYCGSDSKWPGIHQKLSLKQTHSNSHTTSTLRLGSQEYVPLPRPSHRAAWPRREERINFYSIFAAAWHYVAMWHIVNLTLSLYTTIIIPINFHIALNLWVCIQ